MEPNRDTSHPVPEHTAGPVQSAPSTEAPSFLVPATAPAARPDPSSYTGPGAAAAGSTKPDITKPATLDAPFNGAMQPSESAVVSQGSLLDDVSSSMPDDPLPEPPKPVSRQRIIGLGLVTFGILAAVILGLKIELAKSHAQEARLASPSAQLKPQQLPTASLSKQLGTAQTANAVTVNGQLQVTNSLILQPSTLTSPAVTGQMYFNSATNTLTYFNGKHFVTLQGGGNTYITNNAAGNTFITNNTAGNTFNSTSITNVTNNSYVTNVSGGGLDGTGTPGTLAMFNSATTLGDSLITQSGTTLNVGAATGANTTNMQGGTGGVNISTETVNGSSGAISIASGGSNTGGAGNVAVDTGPGVVTGTPVGSKTFEGGTDNMITSFGYTETLAQSTTQAHAGTHSLAVTVGHDSVSQPNWAIIDQTPYYAYPVTPGHKYAFSAWVRAGSNASTITFDADFSSTGFIGGGEVAQDLIGNITDSSGSWKQVTGIIKAPVGANEVLWEIHGTGTATGEIHYLDDMAITDLNGSTGSSELNLGADNAQSVTLGNDFEVGQTLIRGGSGIALNSGQGSTTVNAEEFDVTSTNGVNIDSGVGNANISTSASTLVSGSITIQSGNSSTTSSGDVTVDTGQGFVAGTVTSNFDFEDNTTQNIDPWFGDSVAATTAQAHGGTYSLAMTATGSFWGIILNGNNYVMPVTAGHHVVFSAWMRAATTPRSIAGHVIFVGSTSVPISSVTDSTSGWTQASLSTVVPAGAAYALFSFSSSGAAVGETHYFDDITMTDLSSSASSSTLHLGDTNAQGISIGNMNEFESTTIEGGSGIALNSGAGPFSLNAGTVTITGTAASSIGTSLGQLTLNSGGSTTASSGGGVIVKPSVDTTTAFQVQNASGNAALNVDSAHAIVTVNAASNCAYNAFNDYLESQSPSAYWKLEDSGPTAVDSSGNGDVGTLTNVTASQTPGPFSCDTTHPGMAFSFAAQSKVTTATSAPTPTDYSQIAMFKTSGANGVLIGNSDSGGGNYDRQLEIINGKLAAYIYNGNPITLVSTVSVNDGNWHIAAVSVSSAGMDLYLDGSLVASNNAGSPQVYTGSWTLGEGPSDTAFTGNLAQVAVFPSGLNAIQIQTLAAFSGFYTASLASIGIGTSSPAANLDVEGTALFKNGANSSAAVQIQNSTGAALFTADTADMDVTVDGSLSISGANGEINLYNQGGDDTNGYRLLSSGNNMYFYDLTDSVTPLMLNRPDIGLGSVQVLNDWGLDVIGDNSVALSVQNSSNASLFNADTTTMTVTIQKLAVSGDITVSGHIVTGGSTPTIVAGPGACTGGTVSISGTDTAGTITINTGTGCSGGGTLATVTFTNAFASAPHVVVTPGSPISQTLGAYIDDTTSTASKFDIGTNATPLGSQTFKWNYFAVQ